MEGLNQVFPIPLYMNELKLDDIELPIFIDSNIVRHEIPELKEKVLEIISNMLQEMGYVDQPLKLNDMWFNRYDEKRPFLEYHFHQNCSWTGTYYPEDANHVMVLYNPHANLIQSHYPTVVTPTGFNQEVIHASDIKKGQLIIHPSWMAHQVFWNGGEPSHSISFDVGYELPIGDEEYGSYSE